MMTLYEKIISIYPALATYDFAMCDITLQDNSDGKGAYIAKWEHPTLTQPTKDQLDGISS